MTFPTRLRCAWSSALVVLVGCAPAPTPVDADGNPIGGSQPQAIGTIDGSGGSTNAPGNGGSNAGGAGTGDSDDKTVSQGTSLPELGNDGSDVDGTDATEAFALAGEHINFGSAAFLQYFLMEGTPGSDIAYSISSNVDWVTVTPSEGVVNGDQQVEVLLDRSQLTAGAHSAELTITNSFERPRKVYISVYQLSEPSIPSEGQILSWLQELEPLQKRHHSWPLPAYLYMDGIHPLLEEYVRITHAASTDAEGIQPQEMSALVEVCNRVNASNPSIPATISLNYSPWHKYFPPDAPPTYVGPEDDEELQIYTDLLLLCKRFLDEANAEQGSNVPIDVIFFDSERFWVRRGDSPEDQAWNAAIEAKYNRFYNASKAIFPDTEVSWYSRGSIRRCAGTMDGWCESLWFTGRELGENYAVPLYTLPELGVMRDTFRLTAAEAEAAGVSNVVPWIALGAGYRRDPVEFYEWSWDWNYNTYYSWQLGAEVNHRWFAERPERFAPWDKAEYAFFYPEPFGRVPHWARHFVAYVRGAAADGALPPQ